MAYFNVELETEVMVDAGSTGIVAVLYQYSPNNRNDRQVVYFALRMVTDAERRYSQCEKEALAVWGPERFWIYLMGKPFKLVTCNRAIQLILANTATSENRKIGVEIESVCLRGRAHVQQS